MLLKPAPVSSSSFTFDKTNNLFISEFSTIGRAFKPGRVYDDAIDVGFSIISERTGNHVVFAENETVYNEDGVESVSFVCVTPGFKHLKAVIYND